MSVRAYSAWIGSCLQGGGHDVQKCRECLVLPEAFSCLGHWSNPRGKVCGSSTGKMHAVLTWIQIWKIHRSRFQPFMCMHVFITFITSFFIIEKSDMPCLSLLSYCLENWCLMFPVPTHLSFSWVSWVCTYTHIFLTPDSVQRWQQPLAPLKAVRKPILATFLCCIIHSPLFPFFSQQ